MDEDTIYFIVIQGIESILMTHLIHHHMTHPAIRYVLWYKFYGFLNDDDQKVKL